MPSGHPDFWTATIPGMPAIGAGQVAWYQSEAFLVPANDTKDLINYVVPNNMELHVCSGVVSCAFPVHQRYNLVTTPAATWISPTSHIDPDGKWSVEELAYDGDLLTAAFFTRAYAGNYLELLLSTPRSCNKVRIYAKEENDIDLDAPMEIDVYYEGAWHNIFAGVITAKTWVEVDIGATKMVSKARVTFTYLGHYHYLHEFQFNTSGETVQEGIYFDTHAVIPYLPEAPYLVEAGATFAVRVYNDNGAAHNMSVSIAGFLQAKV